MRIDLPPAFEPADTLRSLAVYADLEERARAASDLKVLAFTIANETWRLFPYKLAVLWTMDARQQPVLDTLSGLASLSADSPMTIWLRRFGQALARKVTEPAAVIAPEDLADEFTSGWQEWLSDYLYVQRVLDRRGRTLAIVAFAIEEGPTEHAQTLTNRLFAAYGHAWSALAPLPGRWQLPRRRWLALAVAVALVAAMFIPVRQSVLAPAEVAALEAVSLNAPMEGVLAQFHIQPNQPVKAGQPVFSLDATSLRGRLEVLNQQLQVAKADAHAAGQKAFDNETSRADLAALQGRVRERQAELAALTEQLSRIDLRAPADGVVIYGDVNDWQGKPVATGERIAQLADPKDAGLLIWLPLADAVTLEPGAPVRVFLQVAPLSPLPATVWQTSYQAVTSPDGTQAYRLRARFDPLDPAQAALARIGLRGTAKLQGERVSLGYYLMRRPLATLREWTGL